MAKKEKDINKKQKKHFFKDMKAELKKVIWPTPKQTANNTLAVIAFTVAIAVMVFVLDVCFEAINKNGVVALQEKIKSSYSSTAEENSTQENTSAKNSDTENATNANVKANTENVSNTESKN